MRSASSLFALSLCLAVGCGDDDERSPGRFPYPTDKTTLIGDADNPDGLAGYSVVTTPDGEACYNLDDVCVKPQTECGDDGAVDVLLDDQGAVVDVICYPTGGVAIETVEGGIEDVGNDVVLVLDDEDDGIDVAGDVKIDGNNVTLYGNGPDTSVIGGNLEIAKNNALVRGVRIEGDVVVTQNNPSIVDCVIEGDLTIRGNNVSIALCEVWGRLVIEGNNAVLVGNRLASAPEISGSNSICNGNVAFEDADDDQIVDGDELGEPIECATKL